MTREKREAYWKENISLVLKLMAVWFVVSFGAGILFAEALNSIQIGGYQLGFWFAQQGSIYTFVALIFIYVKKMNDLDQKYDVHED